MSNLLVLLNNHQTGEMVAAGLNDWMFRIEALLILPPTLKTPLSKNGQSLFIALFFTEHKSRPQDSCEIKPGRLKITALNIPNQLDWE